MSLHLHLLNVKNSYWVKCFSYEPHFKHQELSLQRKLFYFGYKYSAKGFKTNTNNLKQRNHIVFITLISDDTWTLFFNPLWLASNYHSYTMESDIHSSKRPFFISHYISFSHSKEELKTLVSHSLVVTLCTLHCFQPIAFYRREALLGKTNTSNNKRLLRNLSPSRITLKVLLRKHSSFRQQYVELPPV